MPLSDLPNLVEILEREALFENHIFVQRKKKRKLQGDVGWETDALPGCILETHWK